MKALLVANRVKSPKTHDLWDLIRLLSKKIDVSYIREIQVEDLTYYAIEARYPGPIITEEEAEDAIEKADKTME
ncbi:MAG: HEPN domain-containing protein [Desulfurococcales archaeon]|nr:HEPN domain-containing protein [Desulfurococcales archaeon]